MGGQQSNLRSAKLSEGSRSLELEEDSDAFAEDTDSDDRAEVVLSRSESEAWGFAWNVAAHAASRLLVAGIDPNSAAGRWNSAQEASSRTRPICRGDELVEVNGVTEHEEMRRELVAADVARMVFRRPEEAEAELAAVAAAAALAKQRRAARARSAAASQTKVAKRTDLDKDAARSSRPVSVKNTFIHVSCDSDPGDEGRELFDSSSLCPEATLSLSDPLPRRSCESPRPVTPAEGAHSDAESFCSALSRSSAVSQSSGEQRPPSSGGRSCPSTDWEYQVYNDAGSGRASPRQSPGAQVPPRCPMVQPMAPMVPVFVPVLGVQHSFLAVAPINAGGHMQYCGQAMLPGQTLASGHVAAPTLFPSHSMPPETSEAPKAPSSDCFSKMPPKEQDIDDVPNSTKDKPSSQVAKEEGCDELDVKTTADSFTKEPPEVSADQPKQDTLRKKPTRRGGKRARHRPCHVEAAAMEWASATGSIETPSFGDPGSGEEAEGEGEEAEIEADVRAGNATMARFMTSVPAIRAPKPRSFYPLASRLKVATAGLKPLAGDPSGETDMAEIQHELPCASSTRPESAPEEELLLNAKDPIAERFDTEFAAREFVEEVEPEPASASDFSDPQVTAKPVPPPEIAFAVATSPALTRSPPGTVCTATAPEGWPRPASSKEQEASQEVTVGCRVQVVGLTKSAEYNGQWGKVIEFDLKLQRFSVELLPLEGPPVTVKLRRANLRVPRTIALRFEGEEAPSASSAGSTSQTEKWRPSLRSWELAVDLQ